MTRPYGERAYRVALEQLRTGDYRCACGARATTPDHTPPLAEHHHVAGSGCCVLRPSCVPCNLRGGAAVGNRRRRRASRSRLAPASGWAR